MASFSDLSSGTDGLAAELGAVLACLGKLKPQREAKVPAYAERKAEDLFANIRAAWWRS